MNPSNNGYIKNVVLFEENSILPLPECSEPSGWYPVVIINWVRYLGPPGPFSFPDSRDLLVGSRRTFRGRERETLGRIP